MYDWVHLHWKCVDYCWESFSFLLGYKRTKDRQLDSHEQLSVYSSVTVMKMEYSYYVICMCLLFTGDVVVSQADDDFQNRPAAEQERRAADYERIVTDLEKLANLMFRQATENSRMMEEVMMLRADMNAIISTQTALATTIREQQREIADLKSELEQQHRDITNDLKSELEQQHRDITDDLKSELEQQHRDITDDLKSELEQ